MSGYVGAILAAGRGRRMGDLGDCYPKPLLPIANEPLIVHHLRALRSLGITQVYIVVGHAAAQIISVLGDGSRYGVDIRYVEQREPLGSAHALGQLAPYLNSPFVLLLGDIYFATQDLARMLDHARSVDGAVVAAKREPDQRALCEACALEVGATGRIVRIVEKPKMPASDLKGCGIYIFQPEIFDAVRRTPRTMLRDEYELTIAIEIAIQSGQPVYAECIDWDMNITRPQDVLRCNLAWLEREGRRDLVGADVRLAAGTRLERAVIGDQVVVMQPVALSDVVVFQGTQIAGGGLIERALIAPDRLVYCVEE